MNKLLKEARLLLDQSLDPVYGKCGPHQARVKAFLQKTKARPSLKHRAAKKKIKAGRAAARQAHNMTTKETREAVFRRCGGRCESCILVGLPQIPEHMDHWLGGSGRRTEKQSIGTCWMLCFTCHMDRTSNFPSAAYWNDRFAAHCHIHGYPFIPHIIHDPAPAAAAPPSPQGRNAVAAGPEGGSHD